jgi:protein-S-isoprenylcysteine O-methyltransferase Ste14
MTLDAPIQPPPMSRGRAVAFIVGTPSVLAGLLFVTAGTVDWINGWIFLGVFIAATLVCLVVLRRVNPLIFRARSRFQPGTQIWDLRLLSLMLPAALAIIPLAALDVVRFRWSHLPTWAIVGGYAIFLAGYALGGWAQAVNEFFEPGVRIQSERHHRVIDTGPYAWIRHPGYVSGMLVFAGAAVSLGSLWALIPALLASLVLVIRTAWEDQLLRAELAGYQDYARRIRWRLVPGLW